MGEIADSMIDGEFDYITGEYLGEGVGYPRTRSKDYFKNRSRVKAGNNYQSNKSKVWRLMFPTGNPGNLSTYQLFSIAEEYCHNELKLPKEMKEETGYKHILKDEQRFSDWYAKTYPHSAKYLKNK